MNNKSWLVFIALGIVFLGYAVHNIVNIPLFFSADSFSWLTQDAEIIHFINFSLVLQGIWQLGFAAFVMVTAATGYRQNQKWAWYAMWVVPALIAALTVAMWWIAPLAILMVLAAVVAQLSSRPSFFDGQLQPV